MCVALFSLDVPAEVKIGEGVEFLHNGIGTVIHRATVIGDDALIAQNVTIGNANAYRGYQGSGVFKGVEIGEGASICTGAKVLCKDGVLRVGKGTVIGANAVLLRSTGDYEVWGGVPAHLIGTNEPRQ